MSKKVTFKNVGFRIEAETFDKRLNEVISLGKISYWKLWKEWVWEQYGDIMLGKGCLDQVSAKIDELNKLSELTK